MNPLFSVGYLPGEKELRTSGQQVLDFVSAVDPAQGIMRGMAASGRAFDPEVSVEERKAAGIEAALETLAPVGMGVIGALAKQPAKAILMDLLTLMGAPSDVSTRTASGRNRTRNFSKPEAPLTSDGPTRRQVLAGIGSLAIAPEAVLQAGKKVGVKAALTPLASRLAGLKAISKGMMPDLMRQDDLLDIEYQVQSGEYRFPDEDGIFENPYKDAGIPPPKPNEMGNLEARIKEAREKYFDESQHLFSEVADASLSEIAKLDIDSLLIIHRQPPSASGRVSQEKLDAIRDIVISKAEQMPDRFKMGEVDGKKYIVRDMEDYLDEDYADSEIPFADGGRVASRLTGLGSMGYML
jgi:hypothetical protein